ncbi:DUF4166 domain-containing protein [Paenibacillus sp. IITD108]|uniref:DUF4166 domain-containing protein n=1 Tax=Paenibacillus sp. IITD108 TaxID=3116649 RepID=UPI002F41815C
MASIYEQALGDDFNKLHPRIRQRFGFNSEAGIASIGYGVMDFISFSKWAALPLQLGTLRHIMFPQGGKRVPFRIENYAYRDSFGRETVTWNRQFKFPNKLRKFDATMIYSQQRNRIVDYLGNKQHLAVDLDVSVASSGGIQIRSGDQRFYEGWLQFRIPRSFTGAASVCEWYDDEQEQYKINVAVHNPLIGCVFQYQGSFQASFIAMPQSALPFDAKPLRQEDRE